MRKIKVFVDSDVIISSLISSTGAAYFLIHKTNLELYITNQSVTELEIVADRLNLNPVKLKNLIKDHLKILKLEESLAKVKEKYNQYTYDLNDSHIVAGARQANPNFLITYNTRHFKADKIKQDFKIIVITPAYLLQFLRSRK